MFKKTAKSIYTEQLKLKSANDSKIENNFVLFTIINKPFVNFLLNWLCNIHALDEMKLKKPELQLIQSTILIVALDTYYTCNHIKKDWPKIKCLNFNAPIFFENEIQSVVAKIYLLSFRFNLIAALAEVFFKIINILII